MPGCLPRTWNNTITLHKLFEINLWKWNVIIDIHNCFRINYVIIICQMVVTLLDTTLSLRAAGPANVLSHNPTTSWTMTKWCATIACQCIVGASCCGDIVLSSPSPCKRRYRPISEEDTPPEKSTQNKKPHLITFFRTISVGLLTRVTEKKGKFHVNFSIKLV